MMGKNKEELLAMAKENDEAKKGSLVIFVPFFGGFVQSFVNRISSVHSTHCLLN